jgi:hypothetical protein
MPVQPDFIDQSVFKAFAPSDGWFGHGYRQTYDFAVNGGAISTITLGPTIPINTVIIGGILHVITQVTGAGNSLSIGLNTATDLQAVTVVGTYGTAGIHALVPVFTAATSFLLTAARQLQLVISGGAITAGKFTIFLLTYPSSAA